MRLTIGMKLGLGFGLMITLIVAICGVVYTQLLAVQHIQDTVLQVRQPTVLTSAELLSGLSRSQAALRGYLILGDDQSKAALADSWLFIDEDLKKLAALSVDWDEQKDIRHLKEIAAVFNELRDAHHQVEQIAQTPENTPATHLLISQATPKVDAMMTQLAALIEEEKYQEGSEDRKAMLAMMADARGLLASSFGSLRGYVISGDQKDSKAFKTQWLEQQEMVASLDSDSWMLTDLQTESFQAYLTIQSGFDDLTDRVIELRQSDRWNVANHLLATEAAPKATRLEQMLNELIDSHRTRAIADTGELETMTASLVVLLGIVAAIGLTLGIFISWSLKRMIVRSIKPIATRAKAIAQGDLTGKDLPILAPDEIGQLTNSVNEMSHSLSEVVTEVTNSARDVAAAATQIAASSEQMSVGMNEQSQQILQISSAMTQMKVTVIEVASKSNLAASNAAESGQVAREGGQVVDQTIEGIREISKAVQAGSASVAELGKRGQQIGKIIDVINDIADQTNLLALNAAIEAARAGEHGRGFAVVADEVRKLADRTTKATGEIATSIKSIQTETDKAIDRMSVGTEQVDTGVRTAQEAGESLKKILTGAQTVTDMIQAIAAAAEQQSAASEQVTQNVEVVASVSRQAGEGANQASIAASQLSIKAEELQVLVGKFKLDEDQTHDAGPVQATIEVTEYAA